MGADYRALGVARSLGRQGIPVWVVKQGGHLVAATSRYVARRVGWPEGGEEEKIEFLQELSTKHSLKDWLLFPTDDYTVALVARHHDSLEKHYRLTVPAWEELAWACDKRELHRFAWRCGVWQPWTFCPASRDELTTVDCPFPLILKPALRTQPSSLAVPKAWPAEDRESLLTCYDEATRLIPPENLIAQELIPGNGETQLSYAALCEEGTVLASLVARRTRQYPKDFGQFSTYVETVDEPEVMEPAARLLAAAGFSGLVEVEFKQDPRDGRFKLLDVNPRVWGWHTLAKRAGVDFPHLLWRLHRGDKIEEVRGLPGKRWMHVPADLRVAVQEILSGNLSLRNYLRSFQKPLELAIFNWDDPVPGLLDLPLFACAVCRRAIGRLLS